MAARPRVLSLASGVAGLDLGIRLACRSSRVVCYVEGEAYAASVLVARMADGALDPAPIHADVRSFDARPWRGLVDLVSGGYPCQPFSQAGQRRGVEDERHIWPDIARILRECEPPLAFFENVSGHLSQGAHEVIGELHDMGFDVAATLLSAEEVGAPHERNRLFILAAHPDRFGLRLLEQWVSRPREGRDFQPGGEAVTSDDGGETRADPDAHDDGREVESSARVHARGERRNNDPRLARFGPLPRGSDVWGAPVPEPSVRRVDDGDGPWVDRLRALGNAVVPVQAAHAFVELADALIQDLDR